jgi:hypothetical protein
VVSAATKDGWTLALHVDEKRDANCTTYSSNSTNVGEVWVTGGFSVVTQNRTGNNCCQWQYKLCRLDSKKFSLTGYKTVRLKAHLTMYAQHYVEPGGWRGKINLSLISTVPGSPSLFDVVSEQLYADFNGSTTVEKDIDVSLANAIGYPEATVRLTIEVSGGCGGSGANLVWNDVYVKLADIKIVTTR